MVHNLKSFANVNFLKTPTTTMRPYYSEEHGPRKRYLQHTPMIQTASTRALITIYKILGNTQLIKPDPEMISPHPNDVITPA